MELTYKDKGDEKAKITISYTLLNDFRNCRKLAYWKYVRKINPLVKDNNALDYGSLIHRCLDIWHGNRDIELVYNEIDKYGEKREEDARIKSNWFLARAMMEGYVARYPTEDFEVISLEKKFYAPITDLDTLQPIPGIQITGKVDGIVKVGDEYFLLEHKTASKLDSNYLDKLWSDFQIILYTYYVNKVFGITCVGVYYNILVKPKVEQDPGESDEDYKARCREACMKNKSGKCRLKRKMPETDLDYSLRLRETFSDPMMFHRENIYISKGLMKRTVSEISELAKAFLSCIKRERFYLNTDHCFRYGVPCPYFQICKNNDNPTIIENFYEQWKNPVTPDMVEDYDGPLI